MKSKALAHSNIALIKYWGKKDSKLFIPWNSSISITLDKLYTVTEVEFSPDFKEDEIIVNGKKLEGEKKEKVVRHLNLIRKMADTELKAKVISENNFPSGAGLASSASAFAALTIAATSALGLELSKKELSIISRQGSGSSCRSIYGGFVEWRTGNTSEESYAEQIAPKDHWDVRDVIAIVQEEEKKVSSRAGMEQTVKTCPFFMKRIEEVEKYLPKLRKAILDKDFKILGEITEFDCLSMHATMITTKPMLLYWSPETVRIIKEVISWREEGMEAYFTIDAGPNVHVITLPEYAKEVEKRLREIQGVKQIISCGVGDDAKVIG